MLRRYFRLQLSTAVVSSFSINLGKDLRHVFVRVCFKASQTDPSWRECELCERMAEEGLMGLFSIQMPTPIVEVLPCANMHIKELPHQDTYHNLQTYSDCTLIMSFKKYKNYKNKM
jgi:hypothetical protein